MYFRFSKIQQSVVAFSSSPPYDIFGCIGRCSPCDIQKCWSVLKVWILIEHSYPQDYMLRNARRRFIFSTKSKIIIWRHVDRFVLHFFEVVDCPLGYEWSIVSHQIFARLTRFKVRPMGRVYLVLWLGIQTHPSSLLPPSIEFCTFGFTILVTAFIREKSDLVPLYLLW